MRRKFWIVLILIIFFVYSGAGVTVAIELTGHPQFKSKDYLCDELGLKIQCHKICLITGEESFVDSNGNPAKGFVIDDIKVGDIFITSSTHSLGWRHGHAALVVGVDPLKTLEAEALGSKSRIIEEPMWERYATFVQLRLKPEYGGAELAEKAAEYGIKNLTGYNYGFLCDKRDKCITKLHCAFVIWKAFETVGLDIDGNGGNIVTPRNIYNSELFETVQNVGMLRK